MEAAWYNIIIGHIYTWPMFSEPGHAGKWVVFRFLNVSKNVCKIILQPFMKMCVGLFIFR